MIEPSLDDVTVVTVTFNSRRLLDTMAQTLAMFRHVMLVDNGSSDGTLTSLRQRLPQAICFENPRNQGFGRANNQALQQVQTRYALLLNPDCRLTAEAAQNLIAAAVRHPDAALLSPKLYDAPGRLGWCYRPAFYKPQPPGLVDPQGDLCVDFLSGACLLLNMDHLRKVGFFDPWIFLYMEDDDLCERVRRAGHSLVLVHDAAALHAARTSSRPTLKLALRRDYCLTLSKVYLQRKYFGRGAAAMVWLRVLLGSLLTLPLHALGFNRTRLTRTLARTVAALFAPLELTAERCLDRNPFLR